jgi:hypothetical protein
LSKLISDFVCEMQIVNRFLPAPKLSQVNQLHLTHPLIL